MSFDTQSGTAYTSEMVRKTTSPPNRHERPSEPPETPPVFAVMGVTGVGKSTFISQVCEVGPDRNQPVIGEELQSCTEDIESYPCILSDGRRVVLLDTPGFGDTIRSDDEIMCQIVEFIAACRKDGKDISGIVYLHAINDVRMMGSGVASLDVLHDLCGVNSARNVALVTTKWELLSSSGMRATGEKAQQLLLDQYWKDLIKQGSTHLRHLDSRESADNILRFLADRAKSPMDFSEIPEESAAGWAMVRKYERKEKLSEARRTRLQENLAQKPNSVAFATSLRSCEEDLASIKARRMDLERYGFKMEWKNTLIEVGQLTTALASFATLGVGLIPATVGYLVWRGALDVVYSERDGALGKIDNWIKRKTS
ncbi:P-loop containing nucleoside triphosphate hydrolase protein [Echria macrotheca]|uniref:P-loop containing nucleoside triphosphate hydrolase protein n=1 Tax=Echria macrotheca TaxID=438768 RepID=A0AAJ0B9Y1_9PEZI|nr:P-loop containing nucleoside triphosphate hydrolase protein [Echria macrotheca]